MHDRLSLTGKRWLIPSGSNANDVVAALRTARNLPQDDQAERFAVLLPPHAAKAAERIHEAIAHREMIGVFGDYDCDGITSTTQLIRFLRRHEAQFVVRLPHRVHDGYGLRPSTVEELAAQGVTLLVTVDTGISAADAVRRATDLGIECIVIDHHHVPSELPEAYALLHPALDPSYPLPHPSAAGLTFEFLHALEGADWPDRDTDLALATFGVIADLVPLLGRNRALVQEGLRAMRRLPPGPVAQMVASASSETMPISSIDIAFRIAPRINAAGRMADPHLALHALLDGGEFLDELEHLNAHRQDETKVHWETARALLPTEDVPAFLAVADASFQHGIIGLLAGKMTEQYGRPSLAAAIHDGICTASLRSPPSYNIVEGLERVEDLLLSYGGHAQAAGCSFSLDVLPTLTKRLIADVEARTEPEELLPTLRVDAVLEPRAITLALCQDLARLAPFGQGNPEPLFVVQGVRAENLRRVGGDGQHVQATIGACKAIGFGLAHIAEHLAQPVDLVCRLGLNSWNGRVTPQLYLVDAREAVPAAAPATSTATKHA